MILLASGVLLTAGSVASIFTISIAGFPLAIVGLCAVTGGREALWRYRYALLMLLAMIPFPLPFLDQLTPTMVKVSGSAAVHLLSLIDSGEITWLGSTLNFRGWDIFVAEACSGSGTLLTLEVLGLLLAGLFSMRSWAIGLMLLMMFPLTIFINGLRIALTAWVLDIWGPAAVTGPAHEILGQIVVILSGACLALVMDRLTRKKHDTKSQPPVPGGAT